jgi:hypothetical protein
MIEVKTRRDGEQTYVLCRSEQRIPKDRAIRVKQEGRLRVDIDSLAKRVVQKRLVKAEKINQAIGRLKERYPPSHATSISATTRTPPSWRRRSMPTNTPRPSSSTAAI